MKPKIGDVFEYVEGSCFIIGSEDTVYRLSFSNHFELTDTLKQDWDFSDSKYLFNLFDVLGKALGGKYDKT